LRGRGDSRLRNSGLGDLLIHLGEGDLETRRAITGDTGRCSAGFLAGGAGGGAFFVSVGFSIASSLSSNSNSSSNFPRLSSSCIRITSGSGSSASIAASLGVSLDSSASSSSLSSESECSNRLNLIGTVNTTMTKALQYKHGVDVKIYYNCFFDISSAHL
jgi:hypothetical protein